METWNVRHLTPPQSVGDIGRLKIGRFLLVFQSVIGYTAAQFHALFTKPRKVKMKNDFATKADLKKTADGLHHEISAVRTDLSKTESNLYQKIAQLNEILHQEIVKSFENLHLKIVEVRETLHQSTFQLTTDLNDFNMESRERFNDMITAINDLTNLMKKKQAVSIAFYNSLGHQKTRLGGHTPLARD
jgi:hypothetical protein